MMRWLTLFLLLALPAQAQPVGAPGSGAYGTAVIALTGAVVQGVGPCSGTVIITSPSTTSGALTCTTTTNIAANTVMATIIPSPGDWNGSVVITSATGSYTTSSFAIGGSSPSYTINAGATSLTPSPTLTGNLLGTIAP